MASIRFYFKARYCRGLKNELRIISHGSSFARPFSYAADFNVVVPNVESDGASTSNHYVTDTYFSPRGVLVTICSAATLPNAPLSRLPSAYNVPRAALFVVHFHFASVAPLRPQPRDLLHAIIFFVSLISLRLSITHSRGAAFFIAK